MMTLSYIVQCEGFQWDEGNESKNWFKHDVSRMECEQVFFNRPLLVGETVSQLSDERRYYVLGQTDMGRQLFIVFTTRERLIRVISARPMSRREREVYKDA